MSNDLPQNAIGSKFDFWLRLLVAGIVILLLMAIVVPTFVKARNRSSKNSCLNNLRQIDGAKDQWVIEKGRKVGEPVVMNEVTPYIKKVPVCPNGGVYFANPVGQNPTCSIGGEGHSLR